MVSSQVHFSPSLLYFAGISFRFKVEASSQSRAKQNTVPQMSAQSPPFSEMGCLGSCVRHGSFTPVRDVTSRWWADPGLRLSCRNWRWRGGSANVSETVMDSTSLNQQISTRYKVIRDWLLLTSLESGFFSFFKLKYVKQWLHCSMKICNRFIS